ncbi:MAG: EAL domain-containing protein, partial [Vulcanimicrobiaceae bacterium]
MTGSGALVTSPPIEWFDRIAAMATAIFDAPCAFVVLDDDAGNRIVARRGSPVPDLSEADAFWRPAQVAGAPTIVADAAVDDRLRTHPLVSGESAVRLVVAAPIRRANGDGIGAVCVLDGQARSPSVVQMDILERLAALVAERATTEESPVADDAKPPARAPRTARERELAEALRRAIEAERFVLFLQPQVEVSTGRPIGFEALLRWNDPEIGWVEPAEFIPVAEETGLMLPLGRWMLDRTCALVARIKAAEISVAVNLSARQFNDPTLAATLGDLFARNGIDGHRLGVEVTTGTLVRNRELSATTIRQLKQLGLRLVVDDFDGAALTQQQLVELGIDGLKIDRRLLKDVGSIYG